jgi:hypothetical protein
MQKDYSAQGLELVFIPQSGAFLSGTRVEGFQSLEQAEAWAQWWMDSIGWGYSPRAHAHINDEGLPYVVASCATSCD